MKKLVLFYGLVIFQSYCVGQTIDCELTREIIKERNLKITSNKNWLNVIGYDKNEINILETDSLGYGKLWSYNEDTQLFAHGIDIYQKDKKIISAYKSDSLLILNGYYCISSAYVDFEIRKLPMNDFEYQDFWLQNDDSTYKILSYPNSFIDNPVHFKLSNDKNYLILNPYYAGIDILATEDDNYISLYDISNIKNGKIKENIVPCKRCYNSYIVKDNLVFGKEYTYYDKFGNEYTYSNIYSVSINNFNDTTIIAKNIELLDISSDGKFILGKRRLYGKDLTLVIDTDSKRYHYLIGRTYYYKQHFYSIQEKKFVFDYHTHFIYVEMPEKFENNALEPFIPTSKKEDEKYWQNYKLKEHKPL